MKNINELNVIKCAHCGNIEIKVIFDGYNAVQYQCDKCKKMFCKEYKK